MSLPPNYDNVLERLASLAPLATASARKQGGVDETAEHADIAETDPILEQVQSASKDPSINNAQSLQSDLGASNT